MHAFICIYYYWCWTDDDDDEDEDDDDQNEDNQVIHSILHESIKYYYIWMQILREN